MRQPVRWVLAEKGSGRPWLWSRFAKPVQAADSIPLYMVFLDWVKDIFDGLYRRLRKIRVRFSRMDRRGQKG